MDDTSAHLPLKECLKLGVQCLRGIHLGLAVGIDLPTCRYAALLKALQREHGGAGTWTPLESSSPVEVQFGELLVINWQARVITSPDTRSDTRLAIVADLIKALEVWKKHRFQAAVAARLAELGVDDFDPSHVTESLTTSISEFYLNCPEGAAGFP